LHTPIKAADKVKSESMMSSYYGIMMM